MRVETCQSQIGKVELLITQIWQLITQVKICDYSIEEFEQTNSRTDIWTRTSTLRNRLVWYYTEISGYVLVLGSWN